MKFINIQSRDGKGGHLIPNGEDGRILADDLLRDADNIEVNETMGEELSESIKDIVKQFNIPEQLMAIK